MAEESFQEKSEPATGKRRDDSRRKGKVAKSLELNSALIIVFGLLILYVGGQAFVMQLMDAARQAFLGSASVRINAAAVHNFVVEGLWRFGLIILPVLLGLTLIGLASNFLQVGFLFTLEPLQLNLEKLNPLSGIKRVLISRRSMVELLKSLLKIVVVGLVAYSALNGLAEESISLMDSDPAAVLGYMTHAGLMVGLKVGLAFLALAAADYMFQRFEYEREMRMTKQEVKEEMKSQEGDPLVKSRIRSIQRQIAYKRMMHEVPKADVVVTNPTHLAIAIKYELGTMTAPKVIAKGADLIAQRIKEIAKEHGIPMVEDRPLAQALYKTVGIGEEIPEKLFQAVAQVLAYIYRLKNMMPQFRKN
jgi:flagellar biosynthesis protein FlhB